MLERELTRLKKMDNPLEYLEHQTGEVKIYRLDGSFVSIKSGLGKVYVKDSKSQGLSYSMNAEDFIDKIGL